MRKPYGFTVADPDFYAPLESAPALGRLFRPSRVPDGWTSDRTGVWTMWRPQDAVLAECGWKVHVSARPDRLDQVLDLATGVLFEQGVPFKHLAAELFYQWTHHKHAARPQSGKFIAAYPPDVAASRKLMEALSEALKDEEGPYVLSDRRFGESRTVHYRYGAYRRLERLKPDGTALPLVRDGHGNLVEDRRGVAFHLPAGIQDPFEESAPAPGGELSFGGYTFEAVLRPSNGGGAYRGRENSTGRSVFIKEARQHTGVSAGDITATERLRAEWETLKALHAAAPGLAPEPIAYFREWEHEFLVTEFIEGRNLNGWTVAHNPCIRTAPTPQDFADYFARCERIVAETEEALARLHALGFVFVDVSPGNVMATDDGGIRLIDFEAAARTGADFTPMGTPGFSPPHDLVGGDPERYDHYGLCAIAQFLVFPLNLVVQRNPDTLTHLRHGIENTAPVPDSLWSRATRYHPPRETPPLPAPEEVESDPLAHLAALRDATADALVAMADPDHAERVFPTVPEGYLSNTLCLAYGTAGVLHALSRAGRPLPEGALERLRRDALSAAPTLPPGLHMGLSGIAWVLADHGLLQEAADLLATADLHPLTTRTATLAGGGAGVALAHLALYGRTGDEHHLDRARALTAALPPDSELAAHLGPDDAVGLLHGRSGIALLLQQLARVTGDRGPLTRGVRLLHAELDRASDPAAPDLSFPVSETDRRAMPYLYSGSAGVTFAVSRYTAAVDDERLAAALPRLLARLDSRFTAMPGLYQGLSGLGLALTEHARLTGDAEARRAALRVARALYAHAVPHPDGVRFLGDQTFRYSAELWSGSSGVLLFLSQLLDPAPDPFFTVDAIAARS
ncbi:class III lanthionine synthetase LanKC [Streptomyces sparsogenes]|uniref:Serine/threonine protein kinase n=1 Tax=Streptomyces sparsogenes DSM 40356 TaxID=1331668 RepID=A0A1R1SP09_9ACTN|nr:class III lanthionine synthetase LanKC [Streptomyces sparsogenes]OMI39967.1 serine/threonine protein kinase [Streptomyces sparsogenes DSM 40356]